MKRVAKRTKLDETQWWLHKFWATFATWHPQAGVDIRTVQHWLGHKSVETTLLYLQPARGAAINATFAGVTS
jgi:integrase/recombinase XerD